MATLGIGNARAIDDATAGTAALVMRVDACVSEQRPGHPCHRCADNCPSHAISISERHVAISEADCTGCGRCAAACPTEAITLEGFIRGGVVSGRIGCARVPMSERGRGDLVVPCLGGLSEQHLRRLLASPGARITLVDRGWCADCPSGGEAEPWRETLDRTARIGRALRTPCHWSIEVVQAPLPPGSALPPASAKASQSRSVTRRQLFAQLVGKPSTSKMARVGGRSNPAPDIIDAGALERRREELSVLASGMPLPAELFPALSIAATCCNHEVCVRSCPTGALHAVEVDETRRIELDAALCLECGACVAGCPTGSVTLHERGVGTYAGPAVLRSRTIRRCSRCQAEHSPVGDEAECQACRKDMNMSRLAHRLMRRRPVPCDGDDVAHSDA